MTTVTGAEMERGGVRIVDTFAEAFDMRAAHIECLGKRVHDPHSPPRHFRSRHGRHRPASPPAGTRLSFEEAVYSRYRIHAGPVPRLFKG